MYVKEINEVKEKLNSLKDHQIIKTWELPYENLLTRLSAAIFFVDPVPGVEDRLAEAWEQLEAFPDFSYRANEEKKLSSLPYRVTFHKEEKK